MSHLSTLPRGVLHDAVKRAALQLSGMFATANYGAAHWHKRSRPEGLEEGKAAASHEATSVNLAAANEALELALANAVASAAGRTVGSDSAASALSGPARDEPCYALIGPVRLLTGAVVYNDAGLDVHGGGTRAAVVTAGSGIPVVQDAGDRDVSFLEWLAAHLTASSSSTSSASDMPLVAARQGRHRTSSYDSSATLTGLTTSSLVDAEWESESRGFQFPTANANSSVRLAVTTGASGLSGLSRNTGALPVAANCNGGSDARATARGVRHGLVIRRRPRRRDPPSATDTPNKTVHGEFASATGCQTGTGNSPPYQPVHIIYDEDFDLYQLKASITLLAAWQGFNLKRGGRGSGPRLSASEVQPREPLPWSGSKVEPPPHSSTSARDAGSGISLVDLEVSRPGIFAARSGWQCVSRIALADGTSDSCIN